MKKMVDRKRSLLLGQTSLVDLWLLLVLLLTGATPCVRSQSTIVQCSIF